MNAVIQTILERRSIRSFSEIPVKEEEIVQVLEAGINAPSGGNSQPWFMVAILNNDTLKQIADGVQRTLLDLPETVRSPIVQNLKKRAAQGPFNFFYNAPALIIVAGEQETSVPTPKEDCAIATQNMMLAAQSMGLGSCWIHTLVFLQEQPGIQELLTDLGIPKDKHIYSSMALGHPKNGHPKAPPRKEGTTRVIR